MALRCIVLVLLVFPLSGCAQPTQPLSDEADWRDPTRPDMHVHMVGFDGLRLTSDLHATLVEHLGALAGKREFTFSFSAPFDRERRFWTHESVYEEVRRAGEIGDIQVLFLDGEYDQGSLGLAFSTEIVVFIPSEEERGLVGQTQNMALQRYRATTIHELGHVVGLVNRGIPMVNDHVDPEDACQCHSDNRRSVMHASSHILIPPDQDYVGHVTDFDDHDYLDLFTWQKERFGAHGVRVS